MTRTGPDSGPFSTQLRPLPGANLPAIQKGMIATDGGRSGWSNGIDRIDPMRDATGAAAIANQLSSPQKSAETRMQETLHAALQLVSRLCDRGISDRERTDCALRARGSLRLLEQMLGELPVTLTAVPAGRAQAGSLQGD
jgi:hypothetical protein